LHNSREWAPTQPWGPSAAALVEVIGSYRFDAPNGVVGMETHLVAADGVRTLRAMPQFVPSRQLNAAFYTEVISQQLDGTPHSAGLLGWGSDVLGFDTARSTDHGWGPRVVLFTETGEAPELTLPDTFQGWPVRFGWDAVVPQHHVTVHRLSDWLAERLGVDATAPLSQVDWLMMPWQRILEITGGVVFHDGLGTLGRVREALSWYPDDVYRFIVASQWHRLTEEEAFVGRAREVGDDEGALLVEARLRRDLIRLVLLLHRRYPPYSKWLGSAFAQLSVDLPDGPAAFSTAAQLHNRTGLSDPLDPSLRNYYSRPYAVLDCQRFADATRATISDPRLRAFPLIGNVDQVCDSVDVLNDNGFLHELRHLYDALS